MTSIACLSDRNKLNVICIQYLPKLISQEYETMCLCFSANFELKDKNFVRRETSLKWSHWPKWCHQKIPKIKILNVFETPCPTLIRSVIGQGPGQTWLSASFSFDLTKRFPEVLLRQSTVKTVQGWLCCSTAVYLAVGQQILKTLTSYNQSLCENSGTSLVSCKLTYFEWGLLKKWVINV